MNKTEIEIIRNIELICFLNKDKLKDQQKIIIDKLNNNEKFKPLLKYLQKYLFKQDYSLYNYEQILNLVSNNLNILCTERIYLTNNIFESLNGKIIYYLPKKSTNNLDFVTCINK